MIERPREQSIGAAGASGKRVTPRGEPTVIRPPGWFAPFALRELWRFRELVGFLAWRDIKVRYRQTLLGGMWAVLVPFVQMVVFSVIFGQLADISTDGKPAPVFYLAGLVPWAYFSRAVSAGSASLVQNARFLTRIYVPRAMIPAVAALTPLVDFFIACVMLAALLLFFGLKPNTAVIALPVALAVAIITALAVSLFLSALNVLYRDVSHVVPIALQLWMFCTVIVPFSTVSQTLGDLSWLYGLNPMAGVVETFRHALLSTPAPAGAPGYLGLLATGSATASMCLVGAFLAFKHMERIFADVV